MLELKLDSLDKRMAEFRKQRDELRREQRAFKQEKQSSFSEQRHTYNPKLILPVVGFLVAIPLVTWLFTDGDYERVAALFSASAINPKDKDREQIVTERLDPEIDLTEMTASFAHLDHRVTTLTGKLGYLASRIDQQQSQIDETARFKDPTVDPIDSGSNLGVVTEEIKSQRGATAELESRVASLSDNLKSLKLSIDDIHDQELAADRLEARVTNLASEIQTLSALLVEVKNQQSATSVLEDKVAGLTRDIAELDRIRTEIEQSRVATASLETRLLYINRNLRNLGAAQAKIEPQVTASIAKTTNTSVQPKPSRVTSAKEARAGQMNEPLSLNEQESVAVRASAKENKPLVNASVTGNKLTANTTEATTAAADSAPSNDSNPKPAAVASNTNTSTNSSASDKAPKAQVSNPSDTPWKINLISTPNREDALQFSSKAKSKGFETVIEEVEVKGVPYWRVQVQGFASHAEALAYSEKLKKGLGLKSTWILKS
jgi:cell division septation protein DedD